MLVEWVNEWGTQRPHGMIHLGGQSSVPWHPRLLLCLRIWLVCVSKEPSFSPNQRFPNIFTKCLLYHKFEEKVISLEEKARRKRTPCFNLQCQMQPETHTPTWLLFLGETHSKVASGKNPVQAKFASIPSLSACASKHSIPRWQLHPDFCLFFFPKRTLI